MNPRVVRAVRYLLSFGVVGGYVVAVQGVGTESWLISGGLLPPSLVVVLGLIIATTGGWALSGLFVDAIGLEADDDGDDRTALGSDGT